MACLGISLTLALLFLAAQFDRQRNSYCPNCEKRIKTKFFGEGVDNRLKMADKWNEFSHYACPCCEMKLITK